MNQWPPGPPQPPRPYQPPREEPRRSWLQENMVQVVVVGLVCLALVAFLIVRTSSSPAVAKKTKEQTPEEQPAEVNEEPKVARPLAPGGAPETPEAPQAAPKVVNEPDTVPWLAAPDAAEEGVPPKFLKAAGVAGISPGFSPRVAAVAPEATAVAVAAKDAVEVWKGKQKLGQASLAGELVAALALPSPTELVVWTVGENPRLHTLDIASGMTKSLGIPVAGGVPQAGLSTSPRGRYLSLVRNGIRLYRLDDHTLAGILPVASGQRVLAQAFHPQGDKLYALCQTTTAPWRYRLAVYDLATGEEAKNSTPLRPGDLPTANTSGPLYFFVDEQNRLMAIYGSRAILLAEDGRMLYYAEDPSEFSLPLAEGEFWTAAGTAAPKATSIEWGRVARLIRRYEVNDGANQVHPLGVVDVQVDAQGGQADAVRRAVMERLAADGFNIKPGADTKLIVSWATATSKATSLKVADEDGPPKTTRVDGFDAVTPEFELRWTSAAVDRPNLWARKVKIRASDVVCPPGSEDSPATAFKKAAQEQGLAELGSLPIPYFLSQSVVGGNDQLPLMGSRPK